jgi:hypothetical protein
MLHNPAHVVSSKVKHLVPNLPKAFEESAIGDAKLLPGSRVNLHKDRSRGALRIAHKPSSSTYDMQLITLDIDLEKINPFTCKY